MKKRKVRERRKKVNLKTVGNDEVVVDDKEVAYRKIEELKEDRGKLKEEREGLKVESLRLKREKREGR